MIQNLEDFVSMAIQGTQVPMYTKHTLFLYFSNFKFFFYIKNKINKTENKQKHVKQTTWKHERNMHMHEGMIEGCRWMKVWFQKQIRNQVKRVLL